MNYLYFFILIVAFYATGCSHAEHKEEEETFIVTSPIVKDTTIYDDYVCQIHAIRFIEIRALEQGYLQSIFIDEGEHVKKGQLLFQIMPSVYKAEKNKANAEVQIAEIEYKNTKTLYDSNIVSKNELALAKARLAGAKAELKLAKTHLGFTEIRAPFSGLINRYHARKGSLLEEGDLLTSLSDISKMWVYFNVSEQKYLKYVTEKHVDSVLKVKLRMANGQLFSQIGKITAIEANFNNETGNIAFRATFPNPEKILRHGETGNILMPVYLKNALLIPQKATYEVMNKKYVYVIDDNNKVHARLIKIGVAMPHIYQVVAGLNTNDKILVGGLRKVKNNQEIDYKFRPFAEIIKNLNHLHAE